jgi:hypothetical protein
VSSGLSGWTNSGGSFGNIESEQQEGRGDEWDVPRWSGDDGGCRLAAMLAWRLEVLGLEVVATMLAGLVAWSIASGVGALKRRGATRAGSMCAYEIARAGLEAFRSCADSERPDAVDDSAAESVDVIEQASLPSAAERNF